MQSVLVVNFTTFYYESPHLPPPRLATKNTSVVLICYILQEQCKNLHKAVKMRNLRSYARGHEHLGRMVFLLSGPSRGCDAIRSSSSEGLRWLLLERTRKRSAPVDESHRHRPLLRGLRWAVQPTAQPCSGWLGSEEQPVHWCFFRLAVPEVSAPAPQLLTLHIACLHKRRCYK